MSRVTSVQSARLTIEAIEEGVVRLTVDQYRAIL